jgi:hypothetical protein
VVVDGRLQSVSKAVAGGIGKKVQGTGGSSCRSHVFLFLFHVWKPAQAFQDKNETGKEAEGFFGKQFG